MQPSSATAPSPTALTTPHCHPPGPGASMAPRALRGLEIRMRSRSPARFLFPAMAFTLTVLAATGCGGGETGGATSGGGTAPTTTTGGGGAPTTSATTTAATGGCPVGLLACGGA